MFHQQRLDPMLKLITNSFMLRITSKGTLLPTVRSNELEKEREPKWDGKCRTGMGIKKGSSRNTGYDDDGSSSFFF